MYRARIAFGGSVVYTTESATEQDVLAMLDGELSDACKYATNIVLQQSSTVGNTRVVSTRGSGWADLPVEL